MAPRSISSLLLALTVLLVACDGGSGDPCQVESDCDEGLVCCGAARFGSPTRGVCAASCTELREDASTMDAAASDATMSLPDATADATGQDASFDASLLPDVVLPPADSAVDAALDAEVDASLADAQVDAN